MKTNAKLIFSFLCTGTMATVSAKSQSTNFVQILTDDQGWGDLGSFGHSFIKTPHIDKLADEGMKFTHCYSADAVCSPSRASILTGRTPYRNGVYRWLPPKHFCHLSKNEVTLPQLLRNNGYQTGHFGKWHLSEYSERKFGRTENDYDNFGFETNPNEPTMNEYGYDYWFATGNVARPNHKDPLNFFLNGKAMGKMEGFSAQIVATQFVEWMQKNRKPEQPFFITVWFHEPHGPVNSDPKFIKRYKGLNDKSLKQYLANVTQIDEAVGTIVEALKAAGVYDDTMIWYTSDNGPAGAHEFGTFNKSDSPYGNSRYRGSTGGLRGRKCHTHEGGIRVPGIISWPNGLKKSGVKAGLVSAEPIIGSDIFPTMLEAAGVKISEELVLDSSSILPILTGGIFERKRPLYWRNNRFKFQIALRDKEWKIVGNSKRTEFELYNLELDPRESTNLATQYPKVFSRMKGALIDYDKEVLADGPDWWKKDSKIKNNMPID